MLADIRHALRVLLQSKGWTAVVLVSLALGIGANTALFSGVNQLLLQTVEARDPNGLVRLSWLGDNDMARNRSEYGFGGNAPNGERRRSTFSYPLFEQLRQTNSTLESLFACAPMRRVNVVIDGEAEVASAFVATGEYFDTLGVGPAAGRAIVLADDDPTAEPVAMISHDYWSSRFGQSDDTIGRTIDVNETAVIIVGITPPGYDGVQGPGRGIADIHLPLALYPLLSGEQRLEEATTWWLQIVGRLKPGATAEQVRGNLEGTFRATAQQGMADFLAGLTAEERELAMNQDRTAVPSLYVDSARRGIYDPNPDTRRDATILSVVVVLVLLIVCANVANLLLARSTVRQQELSVRQSVGATRRRLIRQLLTESVLLAVIGGLLGLLVALWARQLLPFGQSAALDWRVFAFVGLLSVLTGVVFSLLPALRATDSDLSESLKETGKRVAGSRSLLSKALLVVQVAVSILLLMGAGLFLGTLRNLRSVDVGFDPENILLFRVDPSVVYDEDEIDPLYRELRSELEAIAGVSSVSHSRVTLLSGSTSISSAFLSHNDDTEGSEAYMMTVSPDFFETLGVPVLRGRIFTDQDNADAPQVAVINQAAANEYWGQDDPVGRRLGFSPEERSEIEVIGVVGDTKYREVRDEAPPTVFRPYTQSRVRSMVFQLKTGLEPYSLVPTVQEVVRSVAPRLPVTDLSTQSEQIEGRFRQERYFAQSYSAFGGLATLLAAIGLFGLASYGVAQRTHEIGVRMALGARRGDVLQMVLRESLTLVLTGVVIGIVSALFAGRLLSGMLFGVEPTDVLTMVAAAVLMILVAAIAGYVPARRASRVEPMTALHYE